LQSHLNDIQLLPALPAAWKNGDVKGLVARGAFELEMFWTNGKLSKAFITSKAGGECRLRTNENVSIKNIKSASASAQLFNQQQYLISFSTVKGKVYEVLVK